MINVQTLVQGFDGGEPRLVSADFQSVLEFTTVYEAWIIDGLENPFQMNINTQGSDVPLMFFDPKLNRNVGENDNLAGGTSFKQLYANAQAGRHTGNVNENFTVVAPNSSRGVSVFRYTQLNDPVRRRSSRLINRTRGIDNISFSNNSALIDKVKRWFSDQSNKELIEQILLVDVHSHIRTYNRGVLSSYEDIVAYYQGLNCVMFSILLYFDTGKLILKVNEKMGNVYTAGNAANTDVVAFKSRWMPKRIRDANGNGGPSKLIMQMLQVLGRNDHTEPVFIPQLAQIGAYLKLTIVLFDVKRAGNSLNVYGDKISKVVLADDTVIDEHCRKITEGHSPIIWYDNTPIRSQASRQFECMLFTVTDMFEETMHMDPYLDFKLIHGFIENSYQKLSPLVKYVGSTLEKDIFEEERGIMAEASYLDLKARDYRRMLVREPRHIHFIESAEDYEKYIKGLSMVLRVLNHKLQNVMAMPEADRQRVAAEAKRALYQYPRDICVSTKFFCDQNNKSHTVHEPWCMMGIPNLMYMFSHMYYLTRVGDDDLEWGLPGLEFRDSTLGHSPSCMRELVSRKYNDDTLGKEEIYNDLRNLGSFQLYLNHQVYTEVCDTVYTINVSVKNPTTDILSTIMVNAKDTHIYKTIEKQSEVIMKKLKEIKDAEEDEHKIQKLLGIMYAVQTKAGVIEHYARSEMIFDLVSGIGTATKKHDKGKHYFSRFSETLPIQCEIFQAFSTSTFEPVVPIGYDGSKYDNRTMPILHEVDLSKAYSHILQGGYKKIWNKDIYNKFAQVGGIRNHVLTKIDPARDPIRSYFADYGGSFIDTRKMSWTDLKKIDEGFFNYTSSWWNQFNRNLNFVDNYMIINMCETVCGRNNAILYKDKLKYYSDIQKALGIEFCMFDFNPNQRTAFHAVRCDQQKMERDFGEIVSKSLSMRFIVNHENPFLLLDRQQSGLWCIGTPARDRQLTDAERTATNAFNHMAARFAEANYILYKNAPEFTDELRKELKNQNNVFVGKLKYSTSGGVKSMKFADIKKGAIQTYDDRETKKIKLDDDARLDEVTANSICYGPNSILWKADIHGPEEYVNNNSLVVAASVTVDVMRNSLSSYRRYILNTCRSVMDDLNSRVTCFRVATDSLLVQPHETAIIKSRINRLLGGYQDDGIPLLGHMVPFRVTEVDMDIDPEGRQSLIDGLAVMEYLPSKYHKVRNTNTWSGHDSPGVQFLDETQQRQFNSCYTNHIKYKDSNILYEYYEKEKRPLDDVIGGASFATNGIELHEAIYKRREEVQDVKDFYEGFVEYSVDYLYKLNGCLLVGDPGAGKTFRSKLLCKKAYEDDKRPVVTAAMHSIVKLYGECKLSANKKVDAMTIHRFCKCLANADAYAKNPRELLSTGGYDKKPFARQYDFMICDEIETFPHAFEEYLKCMKELFGMTIYLVGDPLQSAPMMSRGFDIEGSVSSFITNNTTYEFDLQFRNIDKEYNKTLKATAAGEISLYLDKTMSTYYTSDDAEYILNRQIEETAEDIIAGRNTRIFACSSYNVQMCIVQSVLYYIYKEKPELIRRSGVVLLHTGTKVFEDAKEPYFNHLNFKQMLHREFGRKGEKKKFSRQTYQQDRNGPPGQSSMLGTPLIMRKGIQFRVMDRFKGALKEKGFDRYYTKMDTLTFCARKFKNLQDSDANIFRMPVYLFKNTSGKLVTLTSFEVSSHLLYAFAIQREFVLGATLERLTIVQPYYRDYVVPEAYIPIKNALRRNQSLYKEHSIQTKIARLMRVCVTRVTDTDGTFVLDINVEHKKFWEKALWENRVMAVQYKGMSDEYFDKLVTDMHNNNKFSKKKDWKVMGDKLIRNPKTFPEVKCPRECMNIVVEEVEGLEEKQIAFGEYEMIPYKYKDYSRLEENVFPLYLSTL